MKLNTVPTIMTLITAALASPMPTTPNPLLARSDWTLGFGQELQDSGINAWVVWVEGITPCGRATVLSKSIAESPCGVKFTVAGNDYEFTLCDSKFEPMVVNKAGGPYKCESLQDQQKIGCSGSIHDVIKHGRCY